MAGKVCLVCVKDKNERVPPCVGIVYRGVALDIVGPQAEQHIRQQTGLENPLVATIILLCEEHLAKFCSNIAEQDREIVKVIVPPALNGKLMTLAEFLRMREQG